MAGLNETIIFMRVECGKTSIRIAADADAETLGKWWNGVDVMTHAGATNGLSISMDEVIALTKQP